MSRGRKSTTNFKGADWETVFYNSVGFFVQIINKELSKVYKLEPLANHIKIIGGFAFKTSEYKKIGVPIIRISDFSNEQITIDDVVYYHESDKLVNYELVENDIVIALTGGTIGKLAIVQEGLGKLYLNQRVGKFKVLNPEEFESEYVYWIARSVQSIIKNLAWGAAIPNVSSKQIEALQFPLPQKKVQKGIIDFLNDLKNNCLDEEKIYFDKGIEDKIFALQISQIDCNLISKELRTQLDLLKQLRQSFLREAMQGKLLGTHERTEENRETGQQLLEKIKAEKAQLIKDVKLKKEKELPPIKPEEIPFEIPENWVWCRLGEVALFSEAGKSFKCIEVPINEGEWGVIKVSAVSWDSFLENQNKLYSKTEPKDTSARIENGDFLISRANTSELVGKSVIVKNITKNLLLSDKTIRFRFSSNVSNDFLNFCNNLKYARDYYAKMGTGSSPSMKNITRVHMNNLVIPLPPYYTQTFILEKIERIQLICNQLEKSIKQSQQQNEQLLQQVLREALEVGESDGIVNIEKQIIEQLDEVKVIRMPVLQPEEDFFYQKRKVLATYILNQSLSDPYLGDVKFMKLLHLADYHAIQRNLGQKFFQQAAGPYDNAFIYQYFKEIESDSWFLRIKKGERFHFNLGVSHQESLKAHSYFTQQELNEVNKIIDFFKKDNYERPEIISTLFAVWNNRIIKNQVISDELLMQDFLNWDSKKDKYRFRLKNELQWMRDKGIVPKGWGKVIEKSQNKKRL